MSFNQQSKMVTFTRRMLLGGAALTLVACSDETDSADQSSADATKAAEQTEAASNLPQSSGNVDMAELLKPSKLKEMELGNPDASVTIIEYASMTCPHCADFHANTFPALKEKYIETGKVRFILREFPFDPQAAAAIMLARCAPEERFYPMVEMFFKQQRSWARAENVIAELEKLAKLAGFTQESFQACLTNQQLLDDVTEVRDRAANDFGVQSTPSFFINGDRYAGSMSVEKMSALIDKYL